MKPLILSCNTGGGHNAAGKALLEQFRADGIPADFADALAIAGHSVSHRVDRLYVGITTKTPVVFKAMYKAGGAISNPYLKSPVYAANRIYRRKICDYIKAGGYDLVLTPHLFPAQTLTSLRRSGLLNVGFIAVATDYTCIPFWEETRPDYFVIPSEDLAPEFIKKRIAPQKLLPLGIPVSRAFTERRPQDEARKELGLQAFAQLILIMSGSMGFGNLNPLIETLLEKSGHDTGLAVLCGTNHQLRSTLDSRFLQTGRVITFPYTDKVATFMDACDVVITKPGGLTTTEAAAKRIPLAHTDPIPGCETKNAAFFSQRGMSVCCPKDSAELANRVLLLLQDPDERAIMQSSQEKYIRPFAAKAICDFARQHWQREVLV